MKLEFSYDVDKVVMEVCKRTIKSLGMEIESITERTIILSGKIGENQLLALSNELATYGISIINNGKQDLLFQIKSLIKRYVYSDEYRNTTISKLLSEELGFSYSYLSNHFTSKTFTTIENFYVLIRIEKVKELLADEAKTLSDIAYSLNFSSVPHLSSQFKKVTGLTITQYLKFKKNIKSSTN